MNKIITLLSLFAFSLLKNEASAQTVSVPIYFSGYTNECCASNITPYTCFNDGGGSGNCGSSASTYSTTFTNPIPAGNTVTQVSISYYTFECPGTSASPKLNGFALSTGNVTTGSCLCATGTAWSITASSSNNYPCGLPGYNYGAGATETFSLTFTGQVCISQALITFSYAPSSQTMPPTITWPSGDTIVCSAATGVTYSVAPDPTATSYSWSVPGGWVINSGQGTNSINTNPGGSYYICVNASNICGTTSDYCIDVTVINTPTINLWATTDTICRGTGTFLYASGASSYTWAPAANLVNANTAQPTAYPTTATVYTVTGSNACGIAAPQTVSVTLIPSPGTPTLSGISNPFSLCQGKDTILSVIPSGSYYQTWYDTYGNHIITGPTSISIRDTIYEADYITVSDSSANGCVGSPLTIVANIYLSPVISGYVIPLNTTCFGLPDSISVIGSNSYVWTPSTGLNIDTGGAVVATPSVTTNYTVTGTIGGCPSSATGVFTINGYPVPSVSYTLTNAAPQYWVAYPSYSPNIVSADWYWGDGTDTVAFYPSHIYSVAGTYSICVTVTDTGGCSTTYCQNDAVYRLANNSAYSSMVYINVDSVQVHTTNLNKVVNGNEINIYPNPTNGNFVIEASGNATRTVQVYDVNGKLALSQIINGKTNIDASSLNEGVYNINIISKEGIVNKRLVIVR